MTLSISSLISKLTDYRYNPAKSQETIINAIEEANGGTISLVDPTSPFIACLEAAVCCTCAAMEENAANTRKLYPIAAQTEDDLYVHMSDLDFVNRFATPAKTKFTFMFKETEVNNALVLDTATGISKIVIPRNTFVTIANTVFSLQYPIEIRKMAHGGLQIVYDTEITSPLQTLETNIIEFDRRVSQDGAFIAFEAELYQFNITSQIGTLNAAADFKTSFSLTDNFYYVRAYINTSGNIWKEIKTTHTDQVYDVNVPTAVIKVTNNIVDVRIPQIYTSTGTLKSKIRLDYYQTKGPINMVLSEYGINEFVITWKNFDVNDDTVFTAPVKSLKTTIAYAQTDVVGGSSALSFSALRERVIENSLGQQQLPITSVQAKNTLELNGYQIVTNIDNITNRVFLGLKEIPSSTSESLVPSASGCVATIQTTINDIATNNNVIDNGSSITITPKTLFKYLNGVYSVVGNSEYSAVVGLTPGSLAPVASRGTYLYTPNHYVIDAKSEEIDLRPYYLESPSVESKTFVLENDSTMLQVSTGAYGVYKTSTGYRIQIVTNSSDEFKNLQDNEIFVQLAFTSKNEVDKAYINGVYQGLDPDTGERVFTFDLVSNHYIDSDDYIQMTDFFMYTTEPRVTSAPLLCKFDILYATVAGVPNTWIPNSVDSALGRFLLPVTVAGITHETLTVKLGDSLRTLWAQARATVAELEYEKHSVDVPMLYADNVYKTDGNGSMVKIDPATGNPVIEILHAQGTPVLDAEGNQVYKYRKGDVVLNTLGNPVVLSQRKKLYMLDLVLIEGVYWFATETSSVNYRKSMAETLVSWLTNDLTSIKEQLIENTSLYFYPKTRLGQIKALIDNGTITTIEAAQSFQVELYVSAAVSRNEALKAKLTNVTIEQILKTLNSNVVSKDRLIAALKSVYGDDVIGFDITGLGGPLNLEVITVIDPTSRCTIKKKLVVDGDNTLSVKYDVTCNFNRYSV